VKDDQTGATIYAGVYTGDLKEEGARRFVQKSLQSVATGGKAKIWIGLDGEVHKYLINVRVQGRLGNAEVDGEVTKTVIISDRGTAQVNVPQAAMKAIEEKSELP
jgi:hypothetical protein